MKKEIRIVCRKGKYSLRTVVTDSDGDVLKVLSDEVDVWAKSLEEFKAILDKISDARKLPIIHLNSANAHLYGMADLDVGED